MISGYRLKAIFPGLASENLGRDVESFVKQCIIDRSPREGRVDLKLCIMEQGSGSGNALTAILEGWYTLLPGESEVQSQVLIWGALRTD
jgi:hypothetical protein